MIDAFNTSTYLTPGQARTLACPTAPRQCVGPACAAWCAAPDSWPQGSGRCLWHLRGATLGRLGAMQALAHTLTVDLDKGPPAMHAASISMWLAMDAVDDAIALAMASLRGALLAGNQKALHTINAAIEAQGVTLATNGARWLRPSPIKPTIIGARVRDAAGHMGVIVAELPPEGARRRVSIRGRDNRTRADWLDSLTDVEGTKHAAA